MTVKNDKGAAVVRVLALLGLAAVVAAAVMVLRIRQRAEVPIVLRGAVIKQSADTRDESPIANADISAADGLSGTVNSDFAGAFRITLRKGVLPGQPDAGAHLGRLAGHVEPGDLRPPGIGAQQGRENPDSGGLARPVRSQQAMDSALRGDQIEPVERGHCPVALAEVLAHDGRGTQERTSTLYSVGSFKHCTL